MKKKKIVVKCRPKLKEIRECLWGWGDYNISCFSSEEKPRIIIFLIVNAKQVINHLTCCIKGHDLISDDWGGPESGGMGAHCERCGWSWSHVLY